MPTYDYTCQSCEHTMEERQKITDAPLKECPACHKMSLQRGIGGKNSTLRFLGSGFYINDYAKDKPSGDSAACPCGKKQTCDN